MDKILACTDGSLYAPSVYGYAAWAAQRLAASVHVLHLLETPREHAPRLGLRGAIEPDEAEIQAELASFGRIHHQLTVERGQSQLAEAGRQLGAAGVQEMTVELQYGDVAGAVSRLEPQCRLVVMGKRGEPPFFPSQHLGANIESVVRSTIRPVLIASRKFSPIDSFLLAWDGGLSAHKAVEYAIEEPLLAGLRCHVVQAGRVTSDAMREKAADRLREAGFTVTVEVTPGEPEHAIGEAVRREAIGLLVMGAYGHSRLRSLVIGSTTTALVQARETPVLMFRQQTEIRGFSEAGQRAEPLYL
jgi:nucleotide-binding universal stress UspA family protein